MRGKVQRQRMHARARRITPAYAGKRVRCSQQALPCTDHPRMCGEKIAGRPVLVVRSGSPPHVRGKVLCSREHLRALGITPACAGKSFNFRLDVDAFWDHPRMCGEKRWYSYNTGCCWGSPPHVRGKVTYDDDHVPGMRITPACAGKRK